ncbi:MAG: flagellar basal body P-ring formation chaperone FlgA [Pseudomonadota bacterium]
MGVTRTALVALTIFLAAPALGADIVAQRSLRVGAIVAPGDLAATDEKDKAFAEEMVGMEVRKGIFAGRAVTRYHFGPPTLVKRNAPVVMYFSRGALGLRTEGRALASGGAGDVVEVMNLDTRITVRAVITGQNRVEVRR